MNPAYNQAFYHNQRKFRVLNDLVKTRPRPINIVLRISVMRNPRKAYSERHLAIFPLSFQNSSITRRDTLYEDSVNVSTFSVYFLSRYSECLSFFSENVISSLRLCIRPSFAWIHTYQVRITCRVLPQRHRAHRGFSPCSLCLCGKVHYTHNFAHPLT